MTCPTRSPTSSGRAPVEQIGGFVHAVFDGDRRAPVGSACASPHASALAAFRAFNFERIYLRPASVRQAERVIALAARASSTTSSTRRRACPHDATGWSPTLEPGTPETAAIAVRYVSGMTDRYALALGVELLGWRLDALPSGV